MSRQVAIDLNGFNCDCALDEARNIIMGIRGIELVDFDCKCGKAFIVSNSFECNPDEIIRAILEAGFTFRWYCYQAIQI